MEDECLKFHCKEKRCRGDKCTAKRNDTLIIIQNGKFGRYVGLTISIQYFSSYTIKQNKKYTKARHLSKTFQYVKQVNTNFDQQIYISVMNKLTLCTISRVSRKQKTKKKKKKMKSGKNNAFRQRNKKASLGFYKYI